MQKPHSCSNILTYFFHLFCDLYTAHILNTMLLIITKHQLENNSFGGGGEGSFHPYPTACALNKGQISSMHTGTFMAFDSPWKPAALHPSIKADP